MIPERLPCFRGTLPIFKLESQKKAWDALTAIIEIYDEEFRAWAVTNSQITTSLIVKAVMMIDYLRLEMIKSASDPSHLPATVEDFDLRNSAKGIGSTIVNLNGEAIHRPLSPNAAREWRARHPLNPWIPPRREVLERVNQEYAKFLRAMADILQDNVAKV